MRGENARKRAPNNVVAIGALACLGREGGGGIVF